KIATFDHLTGGRLAVHIITGKTDEEQRGDGDFSPKAERYRRAAEYLELMKLTWSSERPFDFTGEFYRVSGAASDVRPLQQPHPLLFFGGASEGALSMGAKLCDVYAIYAEPLASTRERIAQFRSLAAAFGRTPGFNVSLRPIIAAREGEAWDKANRILAAMSGKKGWQRQDEAKGPVDNAGQRLMRFALERDVHDERLWMPIARATGALGNTSCLVGTPEQVAEAILKYYTLGVDSFLIRGFDPLNDTIEFGRELIPRIKAAPLRSTAGEPPNDTLLPFVLPDHASSRPASGGTGTTERQTLIQSGTTRMRTVLLRALAALIIGLQGPLWLGVAAGAEGWTSKPIRLIVPFPPGGTTDQIARRIQPLLEADLKTTIVIQNRGGA